ncbi:hypothetical protein R3P38DRAFT_2892181 [Favolaschia claudopus]|uniref:Uncharacterized protein n=1 Tax=Favolaschia claudopus TaxID=2862362 RepID=A0AAW0CW26_9AGAR
MSPRHIVALVFPSWGHTIGYINLTNAMLKMNPDLIVTIVLHNLIVPKAIAEFEQSSYDKTRLRIVGVGAKDLPLGPHTLPIVMEELVGGWFETITKLTQDVSTFPRPNSIHLDFGCGGMVIERTKEIVGSQCKTLMWWSAIVVSLPIHISDYDFTAIAQEIYADEAKRDGRTLEEILHKVVTASNGTDKISGKIIKYPGSPDLYDYERNSYAVSPEMVTGILVQAQVLAKFCDGFIVATHSTLEPIGVPHCRELYKKRGQEFFAVGPQLNELCWADEPVAPSNQRVKSFLDAAVKQYGNRSVLYISFGSFFFPIGQPHMVDALIETLMKLDPPFPFIFALGGQLASLPAELIQRVNESGKGLICDFWVEQRAILQSGAIGWFLTHGGFNSVGESLAQGIPLIVWSCAAEQPINAAFLSASANPVAIELFQIRTGPHIGPSLHTDIKITGTVEDAVEEFKSVFNDARGARGATLRANAAEMASMLRVERTGDSLKELDRLINF